MSFPGYRLIRLLPAGMVFAMGSFGPAAASAEAPPAATSVDAAPGLVERGRYLAVAADCAACHTAAGGQPFAGGYALSTPLGTIIATNITPSTSAGIGSYSAAQFARAVRDGIRGDGTHLYPAMPYTSYAGITDADIAAMYAYFMKGVTPVDAKPQQTALSFPFAVRGSMAAWNLMFHDPTRFRADPARSPQLNRGAYLVDVLAHCGDCHAPRNALMAVNREDGLSGASLGSWYAPNITSDPASGVGGWSQAELVQYLRTGRAPGKAQAAGPMAEAVEHSLQYLNDEDLNAIASFVKMSKPVATPGVEKASFSFGAAANLEPSLRGTDAKGERGGAIFSGNCASCHQTGGEGLTDGAYPKLFNNTATGGANPTNLIAVVLFGVDRTANGTHAFMPAFGSAAPSAFQLSDQDVADVSNYVLKQFGNPARLVSPREVATVRRGGERPLIAKLGPALAPALVLLALLIVAILLGARFRRREPPSP